MMTNSTVLYTVKNDDGAFMGAMDVPVGTSSHSSGMDWFDAILYQVPVPVVNGRKVVNQQAFNKMLERNPGKVLSFNNISFENVRFPSGMEHLFKDNIYCGCYLGDSAINDLTVTMIIPGTEGRVVMA